MVLVRIGHGALGSAEPLGLVAGTVKAKSISRAF